MPQLPGTVQISSKLRMPPLHVLERGRGVPVVLLHGLGSSHRDWERQWEALAERYQVLGFDLRGHGQSPRAHAGVTVQELARDVARELDRRGLERCHIVGWSLGGMVAACLAEQREDLVRSLVVVNSPPSLEPVGLVERVRWSQRKLLTRHAPLGLIGAVIARRLFVGPESGELRREFTERFAANDAGSYRAVFDAITRHQDVGLLERVTCPVLVVAGDRDYWPVSRKRDQAARFPNARVVVVKGSGHATPVERPEIFNALLFEFLSNESPQIPSAPARSMRIPLIGAALVLLGMTACGGGQSTAADEGTGGGRSAGAPVGDGVAGGGAEAGSNGVGGGAGGESGGSGGVTPGPGVAGSNSGADAGGSSGSAGNPLVVPTSSPSGDPTPDPGSRCQVTDSTVFCEHNVTAFQATSTVTRNVYWQTPLGTAPKDGYPVVFLYQGSLFGPSVTWASLTTSVPFGGFYQGLLQAKLLDQGFTVIAPEAPGGIAWQTNAGGTYAGTSDDIVVTALIAAVKAGHFGPADPKRLYATGISSGGYMTSRMAVSYPGIFRALAIQSGGYATCLGPLCTVPPTLPADHPPTLFLHGSADTTVPIATMQPYHDELAAQGVDTALDVDPAAGHQWLADAPGKVPAWFLSH
jgi:pimeloyl-ACP methyl ester carboxylesterase